MPTPITYIFRFPRGEAVDRKTIRSSNVLHIVHKVFVLLVVTTILGAACAIKRPYTLTPASHATVSNNEALVLSGNDLLEITAAHYIQKNNILLRDNATLIIRNSSFEHRHDYSRQYHLRASDNASVIIENSDIASSSWLNWYFDGNSSLVLRNVKNPQSGIWHIFLASAWAKVDKVDQFWATMSDNVAFDVANTRETFIEFVYPARARVDEAFPDFMTEYVFPNAGESGINTKLRIKNSWARSWGITVNPGTDATIRDTHSLVVTFHITKPYNNATAEFSNLVVKHHEDQTWQVVNDDTRLRLINTKTERWSPIVSGNNILIVKNSEIADNAFSSGTAKVIYEQCVISFLQANEQVHMTIKDSVVEGDVVATGNSIIELINTRVDGKMVEKDNGRIIIIGKDS